MLKRLSDRLKEARAKVAHIALGIELADRRIHHFKHRLEVAERGGHSALEVKARRELSYWRIRKTKLERLQKHWKAILTRRDQRKQRWLEKHPEHFPPGDGGDWVVFDGHEVARWMALVLQDARDSGLWKGVVFSGRRSKVKSRGLCEAMCGEPSCPGRCAGESSNHVGPPSFEGTKYEGAVDVTDPYGLRHYCELHGNPLRGGGAVLPADIPHFSREGN